MEMEKTPIVAILPSPGMGHLIPLVEFAKRLIFHHNLSVTFIVPSDIPPTTAQKSFLHSLPTGISHVFLPPVDLLDLPADVKIETRISLTVSRSLPHLRHVFDELVSTSRITALVVDLFGTDAFDVAGEFNVPPYIFFPTTATALSLFLYLPELDKAGSCEFKDLPEPVRIPGCPPINGKEILDPIQDRKSEEYKWVLHHATRYSLAEGIMVNSFEELESGAVKSLVEEKPGKTLVYPIGPIVQMGMGGRAVDGSGSLKWLDGQPSGSVLFISFGSGGTLSSNQLNELAFGLEMSEQRFIWVVKSPNDGVANATFFDVQSHKDPFDFLPKGFIERTKGCGLVVDSWAPQPQILSHGSTAGFLTHCGWNSTLESIVNGVPLITWPLFAEQKMNALTLVEDLKVALRPRANEDGLIERSEIARVVKALMEGEEGKGVRNRMRDLKEAAAKVLSDEGSSTKILAELARKWKN